MQSFAQNLRALLCYGAAFQGDEMAFKPNYRQQRAERDRVKQAKKQEKLRQRQLDAEQRKAQSEPDSEAEGERTDIVN